MSSWQQELIQTCQELKIKQEELNQRVQELKLKQEECDQLNQIDHITNENIIWLNINGHVRWVEKSILQELGGYFNCVLQDYQQHDQQNPFLLDFNIELFDQLIFYQRDDKSLIIEPYQESLLKKYCLEDLSWEL